MSAHPDPPPLPLVMPPRWSKAEHLRSLLSTTYEIQASLLSP